jgi:EAL domain-containing protein (putative c-di-GMP-specific phosphodiesterase class I)
MPLDYIKLDPKVSASAADGGRQCILVEAVLRMAHDLGIQVVAQGVETMAQFDALTEIGCELIQGHLFSEALDPEHASQLIQTGYWHPPVPKP